MDLNPAPTPPPEFFAGLRLRQRSSQESRDAWETLLDWRPRHRVEVRCPDGPDEGWSALAIAARTALHGHWPYNDMRRLVRKVPSGLLSTCSSEGIPDAMWVWLGGMKAMSKKRSTNIENMLGELEKSWGTTSLWEGLMTLASRRETLPPLVQQAFDAGWKVAWRDRWDFWRYDQGTPSWLDDWMACEAKGWKPTPPTMAGLRTAIEYTPQWCQDNLPWMRRWLVQTRAAQPGKEASAKVRQLYVHNRRLVRGWLAVHRHHDALVPEQLMASWVKADPEVGQGLLRLQASRVAQLLARELPMPASTPRKFRI